MPKFRKKPIIVEAEQFLLGSLPLPFQDRGPIVCFDGERWYVTTIHGQEARIEDGDWIILEPQGDFAAYPCKPDIFAETYEPVPESHGSE